MVPDDELAPTLDEEAEAFDDELLLDLDDEDDLPCTWDDDFTEDFDVDDDFADDESRLDDLLLAP